MNGPTMTAHATSSPRRAATRAAAPALTPALTPLVLAMLAAFPLYSVAQVVPVVPRPTAPAAFVVPRPMPGWRASGTGTTVAPVNQANAAGGTNQSINQTSQSAIYNWQSFDIGSASSVTFSFPTQNSSALNRVTGSSAPSQIFGSLKSQYTNPDPTQAPLTGGSVYLINANGILFGHNAQVNVGALIASTLNVKDANYLSGLTNSVAGQGASFSYDAGLVPSLFTDDRNFVVVDPGAKITTASGGRVFLFAKNVQNAGTITSPDGQVALAAGASVYLQDPTVEKLYASEANANYPAVKGLLVEVGSGSGTASNLVGGTIATVRGNTTLVGMAVNQLGRINATTSVTQNGSVFLLARGDAVDGSNGTVNTKRAMTSGALTLGAGSSIEIAPDTTPAADGKQAVSDGNSTFTASRVELAGKTIQVQAGASIVAHGGIVNARAEAVPNYQDSSAINAYYSGFDANDGVRIVVAGDTNIDVSGTADASVSTARNFVTTQLLGNSDLKDAPLQKSGPLYRSKVTFDLRDSIPILGDTGSYKAGVLRTADERLAKGGSITLASTGAVVTNASSSMSVAGGQVNYTAATVTETRLIGANGTRYTLDQAPKDVVYTGIEGASKATQDRWGIVPQYVASQTSSGHLEQGYVDGQAGGSLTIAAPHMVIDGQLAASTVAGARQTGGQDAAAAGASIGLGFRTNTNQAGNAIAFGDNAFITAGLRDIVVTSDLQSLPDPFWASPLTVAVPQTSRIAAAMLEGNNAAKLTITADGGIVVQPGVDITLAPRSTFDLAAGGAAGISLGMNYRSEGGSVIARTRDLGLQAVVGVTKAGAVTLQPGSSIDVSGDWVNRALDGATVAAATAGGSVTLSSARGLVLEDASRIDVSGGATVAANGTVTGTAAGSVTLESDQKRSSVDLASRVHLGAGIVAQSLVGGGTLALHGMDAVTIAAASIPHGVKDGVTPGSLQLSPQFFSSGAFTKYDIQAVSNLQVLPGVTLAPQASNWVLTAAASQAASGTKIASFLDQGQLPDAQRKPVSLSLGAVTPFGAAAAGNLTLASGSQIVTDPLAALTLKAGINLDVEGRIRAPGGDVSVSLVDGANVSVSSQNLTQGTLIVGTSAVIDVSGVSVRQPMTGLLPQGTVLAGGSVGISVAGAAARRTLVQIERGAVINADGATDRLGVSSTTASGGIVVREQTVSSNGGSVSIKTTEGGATLGGDMHALAGGDSAVAGSFKLQVGSVRDTGPADPPPSFTGSYTIVVQDAPITSAQAVAGSAQVSAQALGAGFANVTLASGDRIRFNGDVNLAAAGNLTLDAPLISTSAQSRTIAVAAGGSLLLGNVPSLENPLATTPIGGTAALALQGGLIEFYGVQGLQGFKRVEAKASSEIRVTGVPTGAQQGKLSLQADLTLSAPQVSVTSNSNFIIDAAGQKVLITGGDSTAAAPLSAGGSITINAREITTLNPDNAAQYGVLRAPFGQITLNATDSIDIGNGSVLSVTGNGMTVLYGSTVNNANWAYDNQSVTAPLAKTVSLNANTVNVRAGSTIDASGGGRLVATEFVAGPGGSTNVFAGAAGGAFAIVPTVKGFAPQDADTLAQKDASGATASAQLGRQITIGAGAPVPAGTYTVLPARYALLDGAFLVQVVASSAPLALGAAVKKQDGSVLVGGQLGNFGSGTSGSLTQTFQLYSSALAKARSEVHQTDANTYFAAQATAAGVPAPRLPQDAGRVNVSAQQLALKGSTLFNVPAAGTPLGGELDISADRIRIGTDGTAPTGVLALNAADLNATGAALLVIGGTRSVDGNHLKTAASEVTLDNAGQPLKGADVVLVATGLVELKAGASIQATSGTSGTSGGTAGTALSLSGDGVLLRVSNDATATTARTGATRVAGDLVIGAGAALAGSSITAEATHSTTLAPDATLSAASITLGANRIAVGQLDGSPVAATTLVLTPALAAQIASGKSLTLRSFDGIDLAGSVTLGSSALQSLNLDTGTLRLLGSGTNATIEAAGVTLVNTSGSNTEVAVGSGRLRINASGANGGNGQVVIGPGSTSVTGAAALTLSAAHEVVVSGQAQLAASGDMTIQASALQATQAANATLSALGRFTLAANGSAAQADAGVGGHLAIQAAAIEQSGHIVLPSGELGLTASTGDLHLAGGATIDLAGRGKTFDSVVVATSGGDLSASATQGNVRIDTGALLDVSAANTAGSGGSAGSIALAATGGSVTIGGSLRGTSSAGQGGATLSIDSVAALDLGALATTLVASAGNFSESISVRNRVGDQQFAGGGPGLAARHITLASDGGSLTVAGTLTASGASGTSVVLAAGNTLTLADGALISAHSSGSVGGEVQLMAGTVIAANDGSLLPNGQVMLNGGAIDTSAATGGVDGKLLIRAQRSDAGTDVRVGKSTGSAGTAVKGATGIEVEAVKQYQTDTIDSAFISQVSADNIAFAGVSGVNATQTRDRVAALFQQAPAVPPVQLRAGVEVDQTDTGTDLVVLGNPANNGWNLTAFNALGQAMAQPSGAPVNLTLRAAGNLAVLASISDDFMPAGTLPTTTAAASKIAPAAVVAKVDGSYVEGSRIRLVGGADLGAANVMATQASTDAGDVTIGNGSGNGTDVIVRSTTGMIQIAAGRDVTLTDHQAVVYTTGRPVAGSGYVGLGYQSQSLLGSGGATQSPTLTGGGSISVQAARDVTGAGAVDGTGQYGSEWLWRGLDASSNGQATWWARYDRFQQGFGTFGGGNVLVSAGRDAVNVEAVAASNGYIARDTSGSPASLQRQGGGDLSLTAGREIAGGFVLQDAGALSIRSGRDITAPVDAAGALQALHGNSVVDIEARNNADVGLVTSFGLISGAQQAVNGSVQTTLTGVASGASLRMVAAAGDLNYRGAATTDFPDVTANQHSDATGVDKIIPDTAVFAAPGGSVNVGPVVQVSGVGTQLNILARQDATVSTITVAGTDPRQATPTLIDSLTATVLASTPFSAGVTPLDQGARDPVRIVANDGDIALTDAVNIVKPIRLLAGRDVSVAQNITVQHQADDELSLVQAGRDIAFTGYSVDTASFKVYGPGNLVTIAGRNIELNTSGGFGALGNRENAALPAGSATLTLLAGVSLGRGDYAAASSWYFDLLGGTGIAAHAPDLAAQLMALQAGQALPGLGSSAASAYKSAPIVDQITQTLALVGQSGLDAAVLADAQRQVAPGSVVSLATATANFSALTDAAKGKVLGAALATAWSAKVAVAQQRDTVLAMVSAQGLANTHAAALVSFVAAQTGQAGLDLAQSLTAFQGLAAERRLVFTNQVLLGEIRNAGRAASALSGTDRDAAYARAYDALAVVFPDAGTDGNLQMGSSQLRTYQNSAINVLTPRGGVNVGELASSSTPKSASALGIVTGAGGDISMAVRDNVDVNQSRVFTVGKGDLLIWSSDGNIDAGRGAKTVTGAPPPVFRFVDGNFVIDTSGSYSGSGIAVLDASSTLDLYAPVGEINAGDAGIKSLGNAFLGAARFVGADNLSVGGVSVGAPPPASTGGNTAGLAGAGQAATTAATRINSDDSEEEKQRKRRKRLNLILDFLGFGDGSGKS